jgi:pimeloyl-ACP methyl ester carboxylesterase
MKISPLNLLPALIAFSGYAQPAMTTNYDTLRTASHIPDLNIALLHEAPGATNNAYPVLFIHGSVIPVNVSFGLRMNNYSWMDNLSENGYDVYALDFLGYGNSDRYPEMRSNSSTGRLPGRATDVYLDVDKAVDFICRRTGKNKVYLIGHSWGGSVAALYAGKFKDKVEKLVLYAPITPTQAPAKSESPAKSEAPSKSGAPAKPPIIRPNATMTPARRVQTFKDLTPAGKECRMEKEMFTTFGNTWLLSDPLNPLFRDDSVRFPSGPEQDTEDLLHNKTYYNPADIQVPVLLVRGEWDNTPDNTGAAILFAALENAPYKKYTVLEKGTHIIHLEKSRYQLYDEVLHYLNAHPF